jgi:hypothetical protein
MWSKTTTPIKVEVERVGLIITIRDISLKD